MKHLKINSTHDLRKEGKSFYWASFFLPRKSKLEAGTLYSICRYFDNIADENNEDKTVFLRESIEQIKKDKKNDVNIFLKKNNINVTIFSDLIEGLIIDQKTVIIKNRNDLIKYSYHVAGTVGLMMSKIIGVKSDKAAPCAIDLGIAMQLTNIARDVYEDAQMQRVYLPSEWLPNINLLNLKDKNSINLDQEKQISDAIHRIIDLSNNFYKNGFAGLRFIPLKTRLGIYIAANVYRGIGIKIKKNGKKYLKKRIYLNSFEKTLITIKSIILFIFIPIINYKYLILRENLPNENL